MCERTFRVIWIVGFLAAGQLSGSPKPLDECLLRVYLPRQAVVKDDVIRLGQVTIVRGDAAMAEKAHEIALGRLAFPGQQIHLDRPTILARLACSGLDASDVTLCGAQTLVVSRQEQVITSEQLVKAAQDYLVANPPWPYECSWRLVRSPGDVAVAGIAEDLQMVACLKPSPSARTVKVEVGIEARRQQVAKSQVEFAAQYKVPQAVAVVDIPAGAVISEQNTKLETTVSDEPPKGWRPPYGLVAKRLLRANSVIRPELTRPVELPVLVERNKTVLIKVELPGLRVSAIGQALQDGRVGEYIKVRNIDSQRIIAARVNEDGTVVPVF